MRLLEYFVVVVLIAGAYADTICKQRALGFVEKDAKSCTKFHMCSEVGELVMECPKGTYYNSEIKACDCGPNKKCGGKTYDQCPAAVRSDVCSRKGNGEMVSHPYNCGAFYQCSERGAMLFTCPSGTLFNSETKSCDYPENTKCTRAATRLCCGQRPAGCCPMPPSQSQCAPCIGQPVFPVIICCPPPPSCVPCVPPPCWPCNGETTTAATTTDVTTTAVTTTTNIPPPPPTVIPTPAPTPAPTPVPTPGPTPGPPGPPPPTVIPTPAPIFMPPQMPQYMYPQMQYPQHPMMQFPGQFQGANYNYQQQWRPEMNYNSWNNDMQWGGGGVNQWRNTGYAGNQATDQAACPNIDDPEHPLFRSHESKCSNFYKCTNGALKEFACPSGLLWDSATNRCKDSAAVVCNKAQN